MFKRIINTKGFWTSVISLALAFALLFVIVKWAIEGFDFAFITDKNPLIFFTVLLLAGFIYGFFVTYGKFNKILKENDRQR